MDKNFYDIQEQKLRHALLHEYNLFNFEKLKDEYILSLDPIIKKYAARYVKNGTGLIEFEDYVYEAYTRVYEKFDEFKFQTHSDIKLATFMTWHIMDAMQSLKSHNEQAYKCSTTTVKILPKIKAYIAQNPDKDVDEVAKHFKTTRKRLLSILDSEKRSESIYKTISDDGKSSLIDTFHTNVLNSEEVFILKKSKTELKRLLKENLSEKEEYVLSEFFGLDGNEPKNLVTISKQINLSKERIRQIKEEALENIRKSKNKTNIISLLSQIVKIQSLEL